MGGEPDAARLASEAHRVLATFVADDTLHALSRALAEELRCGSCFMLFTPRGEAAVSTAGHRPDPDLCAVLEEHANFLQRTDGSRLLAAVQSGETTIATAADLAAELPYTTPEFRALTDRIRLRAVLGVPVRLGDEITGAILLSRHDDDERPFSDADRERAARELGPMLDHARFRAAFEHAPTGMALLSVGRDGHRTTIVEVNAALCRMAGAPREELVGMDPAQLAHPDDRETDFDQVARLFAGGLPAFSLERRFVRADGSVLWTQLHVSMIRSGGRLPSHLVVQVQEITYERRLAALVEHTQDAIVGTDLEGTVRSWNRGAERLYGRRAAEILGRSIELTVPPERRGGAARLVASVARGEDVVGFETVALTGDGRRRDIVLSLSPVRDAEGHVTGVAGVARDISDRKRSEALTRGILAAALEAIVTVKPDATIVGFNPAAERMFGRAAEEVLGRSATELLVAEQDRASYARTLLVLAEGDDPQGRRFQLHGLRADGTTFPGEVSISRVPGEEVHITGHIRDVSDRRRRELEDQLLAALTRRALEGTEPTELMDDAASAVCEVLAGEVEVEVHERAGADRTFVRGTCGEQVQRPRTFDILPGEALAAALERGPVLTGRPGEPGLPAPWADAGVRRAFVASFGGDTDGAGWLCVLARKDCEPSTADRAFTEAVANLLATVVARREAERELAHRALHDGLTGLPNRTLFLDRVEHVLERAGSGDATPALVCVGLDRFKQVNDELGHAGGDELLRAVAERLRAALDEEHTVARISGDQFAILHEQRPGKLGPIATADAAIRLVSGTYKLGSHDVVLTASAGLVLADSGRTTPEALLHDAVVAMYRAKEGGGGRFEIFANPMRRRLLERTQVERDLRLALEQDRLEVHYQPIVGLGDGGIRGVEALVRWRDPVRGLVAPADFIPVAEETGLILQLGRWVLEEACRQLRAWDDDGVDVRSLSVNLSARQLADRELAVTVLDACGAAGVAPERLQLEVTESVLLQESECARVALDQLRGDGVRILLDDFGTGWSSLGYLRRLPVDGLKIDRSFVSGLGDSAGDRHIVGAITGLAEALELDTVAEGVETVAHARWLRTLGCGVAQGFAFARPAAAGDVESLLRCGLGGNGNGLSEAFGPVAGEEEASAEEQPTMTLGEAQRALGVSPSTVRRLTDAGRIRSVRTAGGHRRLVRSDVERVRRERAGDGAPVRTVPWPAGALPGVADLLASAGERCVQLAARRVYDGEGDGWFVSRGAAGPLAAWAAALEGACRTGEYGRASEGTAELLQRGRQGGASMLECHLLLEQTGAVVARVLADRGGDETEIAGVRRLLLRLRNDALAGAG